MLRLDRAERPPGLCRQSLSLTTATFLVTGNSIGLFNDTDLIDSAYEAGPVDALRNEPFELDTDDHVLAMRSGVRY